MHGSIAQINVSQGGLPKRAVEQAEVTETGLVGDGHRDKKAHGGPERAVCLFALENLEAMQADGHPIDAGAAGENITTRGVDWATVVPGTQLRLGEKVLVEVSGYTTPCDNLVALFSDGDYTRMDAERNPGNSRVYARVLEGGAIQAGDRIEVLSPSPGV